jgi:hypothetical protein
LNVLLARLFSVGLLLLIVPITVVFFQGYTCTAKSYFCFGIRANKTIDALFPYVMLLGGLLVGYGMKRLADLKQEEAKEQEGSSDASQS